MNSHKNARLAFQGRVCLIDRVLNDRWRGVDAARAFVLSERSVRKWKKRFKTEGERGLLDRSSRPHRSPRKTSSYVELEIKRLREQRKTGPQIADHLSLPISTVGDVLRRLGMGRLPSLNPRPPIVRYEREQPGELLHVDSKRLAKLIPGMPGHRVTGERSKKGRMKRVGFECLHVAVDDASRVAYAEILPDGSAKSAVEFLDHAVAHLFALGVRVEEVMTDNAFCYTRDQYARALNRLGIRHIRIRPFTPRTNGKAERFIQTALREWAYAKSYSSSQQRTGELEIFVATYNTQRPHTAHGRRPPITRLRAEQPVR